MSLWNWIYRRWFYGEDEPNTDSCLDLNNNGICDDLESTSECMDLNGNGICDYFEDTDTYDWSDDDNSYWNTNEDEL